MRTNCGTAVGSGYISYFDVQLCLLFRVFNNLQSGFQYFKGVKPGGED